MRRATRRALILAFAAPAALSAQQSVLAVDSARLKPRSVQAVRVQGAPPRIDGTLDDAIWKKAFANPRTVATDLVEQGPRPGTDPALQTKAAFAFDDKSLYVAVRAFDSAPEAIVAPYPRRDDETTSEWIFVEMDTRHDRRNAFSLGCNPRSVQVDGTFTDDINYDPSWNGVWECGAQIDSLGWTVEYRIPFSQLRPAPPTNGDSTVVWGLNVYRYVAHTGETANWSPRLPSDANRVVSRFNELRGIVLPSEQHRVDVRPFALARSEPNSSLSAANRANDTRSMTSSAGMDITAHLPRGFTFDGTVLPDFGQVEADPSQINLTTFETFLPEQRPFFINGSSAFNLNIGLPFVTRGDDFSADRAFYSRRIGAPPHGAVPSGSASDNVPASTGILGAGKITGRLASGWTLGGMATMTRTESADYRAASGASRLRVEPPTLYGAVRAQRDFRNGASSLGVLITDVERSGLSDGLDSLLVRRATVIGVDGRHRIGNYELSGFTAATDVEGSPLAITRVMHGDGHFLQRPDAQYANYDSSSTSATGMAARVKFARIGGGNLTWSLTGYGVTPRFDADDQGFQRNADWLLAVASVRYQVDNASRLFQRWAISSNQIGVGWSFGGERRTTLANVRLEGNLWNYWGGWLSVDHELSDLSLDLLRGGAAVVVPTRTTASINLYSDSRRTTQFTLAGHFYREPGTQSKYTDIVPSVTSRVTDRLALTGSMEGSSSDIGWQYLGVVRSSDQTRQTVLARLHGNTLSVTTRADYAFSPHLTIQAYAQPYIGTGRYSEPKYAVTNGARADVVDLGDRATRASSGGFDVDFNGDGKTDGSIPAADFNLRELHGSAVMRWEYRPGSELFLVWTQTRSASTDIGTFAPSSDASALFRIPPRNVVMMKLSYRWEP